MCDGGAMAGFAIAMDVGSDVSLSFIRPDENLGLGTPAEGWPVCLPPINNPATCDNT